MEKGFALRTKACNLTDEVVRAGFASWWIDFLWQLRQLSPVLLFWILPPASCSVAHIRVEDRYITASGQGASGVHELPATQSSFDVGVGKILYPGCALSYRVVAVDATGNPLAMACQVSGLTADGQSWEGI
jgi:hypothetical protein